MPPCPAACAMPVNADRAGEAVDQRGAVEQHAGRQRAEHEIFQAGLGRAHVVAVDRGDHVERRGSSARGRDRARSDRRPRSASHAGGREQDQDRVLERLLLLGREIVERQQDRDGGADQRQDFMKRAKSSTMKLPPKVTSLPAGSHRRSAPRRAASSAIAQPLTSCTLRSPRRRRHQQHHRADRQDDLRQRRAAARERGSGFIARPHCRGGSRAAFFGAPSACCSSRAAPSTDAADMSSTGFG